MIKKTTRKYIKADGKPTSISLTEYQTEVLDAVSKFRGVPVSTYIEDVLKRNLVYDSDKYENKSQLVLDAVISDIVEFAREKRALIEFFG